MRRPLRTSLTALALTIFAAGVAAQSGNGLLSAFSALKSHITGTKRLTAAEIDAHKRTIDTNRRLFGSSRTIIAASFDLVATYDRVKGPLWIARGQFDRRKAVNDIDWTLYHVMQYIVDEVYTAGVLAKHASVLDGFKFGSSAHFPGAVKPPADPKKAHSVRIDTSYPDTWGRPTMHEERPARKPTGTYLAPGSIATVTVPAALAGKGYKIRVGAHSWDMSRRPWVRRLDRCTCVYDIRTAATAVASPLGGGIYVEVPLRAKGGIVTVTVQNAVRSPYFSAKRFHATTNQEWRATERRHNAPWADLQSEKFLMQVPTSWIYRLDDPARLMRDWDAAMDATNDLMGFPRIRGKEALYAQVDLLFRASVYAPGYPSVNVSYDPKRSYGGNHGHHLIRGPQRAGSYEFHEMGHGYLFQKFPGETESNVNLLHVAVWNRKFGYDLDTAFRSSAGFGGNGFRTLDHTAIAWMMCQNFKSGNPMAAGEKAYQLKGHAKFVDIARLYGWGVLGDYWKSFNADYEKKVNSSRDIDSLIFRLSQSARADLRPLLHFWGTHPQNSAALEFRIKGAKLQPSGKILALLQRYERLVPADRTAYRTFAFSWWGRAPRSTGYWTERDHAKIWSTYDKAYAAAVRDRVRRIIGLYFDAYQAKLTSVGSGCIAKGRAPLLSSPVPVLGKRVLFDITYARPNAPAMILLGSPHPGLSIGGGCTAYVDPTKPLVPFVGTVSKWGYFLSPWFELSRSWAPGTTFGVQGAVYDAATAPLGFALSNGLVLRLGY